MTFSSSQKRSQVVGGWINASLGIAQDGSITAIIRAGTQEHVVTLTPEVLRDLILQDFEWRKSLHLRHYPNGPTPKKLTQTPFQDIPDLFT